ncbi:MAG: hypothetical protein V4857_24270 [Pseudomonadota bacterium]
MDYKTMKTRLAFVFACCAQFPSTSAALQLTTQRVAVERDRPSAISEFRDVKRGGQGWIVRVAGKGKVASHIFPIRLDWDHEDHRLTFGDIEGDGVRELYACGSYESADWLSCDFFALGARGRFQRIPIHNVEIVSARGVWSTQNNNTITGGRIHFLGRGLIALSLSEGSYTSLVCYRLTTGVLKQFASLSIDEEQWGEVMLFRENTRHRNRYVAVPLKKTLRSIAPKHCIALRGLL